MSRKRKRCTTAVGFVPSPAKRLKGPKPPSLETVDLESKRKHAVLSCYYHHVVTLRDFILSELPVSSNSRRRKIANIGPESSTALSDLLDRTLVGVLTKTEPAAEAVRHKAFVTFTQAPQRSVDGGVASAPASHMSEVVDFVIWSLFQKSAIASPRPHHILCHGYQRSILQRARDLIPAEAPKIPGIILEYPNDSVQRLKSQPWTELLPLLGSAGDAIMRRLLLDCGLFVRMDAGKDNYYQLSGEPISNLPATTILPGSWEWKDQIREKVNPRQQLRAPNDIVFVRNRMLYARPSLNGHGKVKFGVKRTHVLSRFPDPSDHLHTFHIMKYFFPKQFGLHNVLSSSTDPKETSQTFMDYTFREAEISEKQATSAQKSKTGRQPKTSKIPKRLRGQAFELVRKIQRNHRNCPYVQLLRYYCCTQKPAESDQLCAQASVRPRWSNGAITQLSVNCSSDLLAVESSTLRAPKESEFSLMDRATPLAQVSAFCQAILQHLLPRDTFGSGALGDENRLTILQQVDRFIKMRRHENLNLHHATQGIKIKAINWLCPLQLAGNMSPSDRGKRREILHEFVYYLFDSILIPLIRSNFYVTESSVHRNRLFYFRHDVWRKISEPTLAQLKLTMFEANSAKSSRNSPTIRKLGYSTIRLLPKLRGTRIIANLRKKTMKNYRGRLILGSGVNKQLEPVYDALTYERSQGPPGLASAMFSTGEIYARLKLFKAGLGKCSDQKLFFVKLDIRSCFDSIPQMQLAELVKLLFSEDQYRIHTHIEIKPALEGSKVPTNRKFPRKALPLGDHAIFSAQTAAKLVQDKNGVLFADTGTLRFWGTRSLLGMLREHILENTIKIGKKQFRQTSGIPQGSILSSLLCSFFYGAFEAEHLSFLNKSNSMLMRYTDDFLLITTEEAQARQFLNVMIDGKPAYGISIEPKKSMTNFDATVHGRRIPRNHRTSQFPYCGLEIDTQTLAIGKGREEKDAEVRNGLTVTTTRNPGVGFRTKVLHSLKIQMLTSVLDTSLNPMVKVMTSIFECFTETAMKMHQYVNALRACMRPSQGLIINVLQEVVRLAFNLMRQKTRARDKIGYKCDISKIQTEWLAAAAFEAVLQKKQSRYREVLDWLQMLKASSESGIRLNKQNVRRIFEDGSRGLRNYLY